MTKHSRVTDTSVFAARHISIENVNSINELKKTDLHNIPLLYVIDRDSLPLLKSDLRTLKKRSDVVPEQIFFRISPTLREGNVIREIIDLGMTNPNVVQSADDPIIIKYFEIYPFTDYIRDTMRLFRKHIPLIKENLDAAISETRAQNQEQHAQIEEIDAEIACLKESLDKFINPDRTDFSPGFLPIIENLKNSILNWRSKKTKITQQEEADRVAGDFERDLQEYYQDYLRKMHSSLIQAANAVQVQQRNWYNLAFADIGFMPERIPAPDFAFDSAPLIKDELLKIKEEAYVTHKEDFLGWFFKPNSDNTDPVLEVTYYYASWRNYALSVIEPYLYKIYSTCIEELNTYFDRLGSTYKEYLRTLLGEKESKKADISSSLSVEEQLLQNDNNWLVNFTDMVKAIERD